MTAIDRGLVPVILRDSADPQNFLEMNLACLKTTVESRCPSHWRLGSTKGVGGRSPLKEIDVSADDLLMLCRLLVYNTAEYILVAIT